jgi:hypothetical protein
MEVTLCVKTDLYRTGNRLIDYYMCFDERVAKGNDSFETVFHTTYRSASFPRRKHECFQ